MIGTGDALALISNGDFDVAVVFTRAAGGTVSTRGHFTDSTDQVDIMSGKIEANDPMLDCETASIATVKRGDTVLIGSVTYKVERQQVTGIGFTTCYLKAQ